jgi:hypothetical protein
MGKITVQNETIEFREREMKVDDLKFWPENPRVYSALRLKLMGEEPSQKDIEEVMTSLDNVKRLRSSIKAVGGLTHPLFVRNGVVIEGNSRLAAYRLLCRVDKIRWAKVRCNVLPEDMSDDLVFALIGSIHIDGVTEWTPFEQAGYLFRHLQKSKKPIEAIAKDCGLTPSKSKQYVKVYETMLANDDTDQSKFSYYLEMLKNGDITSKSAKNPELNLIDTLCQKIKSGTITKANELRDIAKLAKADSADANMALKAYLNDEESLSSAVAKVSEEDKKRHARDVASKFREFLTNANYVVQLMAEDEEFKFEMDRIISRLNRLPLQK